MLGLDFETDTWLTYRILDAGATAETQDSWQAGGRALKVTFPPNGPDGMDYGLSGMILPAPKPRVIYIGFDTYHGPYYAAGLTGEGTDKPLIVRRTSGVSGHRIIWHHRERHAVYGDASTPALRHAYLDNNIELGGDQLQARVHTLPASGVDVAADTIAFSREHFRSTGDRLVYSPGTLGIGGLEAGRTYYAIRVDATQLQLAATDDDALAGTPLDLASQGAGTHILTHNQMFVLDANTGKWFHHEFMLDMERGVIKWWITSRDRSYNTVIPTSGHAIALDSSNRPLYQAAQADRSLLQARRMSFVGDAWNELAMSYFGPTRQDAGNGAYYLIDNLVVGTTRDAVAPRPGF